MSSLVLLAATLPSIKLHLGHAHIVGSGSLTTKGVGHGWRHWLAR